MQGQKRELGPERQTGLFLQPYPEPALPAERRVGKCDPALATREAEADRACSHSTATADGSRAHGCRARGGQLTPG